MTIKDIIVSVSDQLSYSQGYKITTTEFSFALTTRISAKILLIFSFIITIRQLFGSPIACQVDQSYEKYTSKIETRCWIEGSYIIRQHLEGTVGKDIVNYGIGTNYASRKVPEERIYQNYYQWVTPTLLIMSSIFYLPQFIWHNWECGIMEKLLKDIDLPYINDECWMIQKERLLRYLHGPKRYHRQHALKYYCCEFLALGALILNMFIMDAVFNNFWTEFYPAIHAFVRSDLKSFAKHSAVLFPSQAKCDYFNFGSSGSIQKIDSLCVLPQNKVNEKIFVFLYFWMIALLIMTVLHIIGVVIKLKHQCTKNRCFGYGLTLSIMKKNLSPILVDDLLENSPRRKRATRSIYPPGPPPDEYSDRSDEIDSC